MASQIERGDAQPIKRAFLDYVDYSALIPNKVSMARDQLANDRNFLTFFRYSCTLIILGFTMLVKFRLPESGQPPPPDDDWLMSRPFGYTFIALGLCLFIYALTRYFRIQYALIHEKNNIEAGWFSFLLMIVLALFIIVVSIISVVRSYTYLNPPNVL
ncbi:hypothetical protein DM01DRAFT_1336481 [Hesseltinella vesiculosa]|uniref:DUF202 domain-containing protein n=1 Tax=Hesseltinella vesiculosa TaxID=101127 RepID=A0A1X2GFK7_9FUNG|nr:hypothetical protein DM01DRAFT_1336481 [Hesseltinella vesiculosa]